jgi:MFS transporter, DHA2 family, multidrug resistance protein
MNSGAAHGLVGMQTISSASTITAGRREWIALAVLALPCMLVTMDLTVLFLAVPALTADLDPSSAQLLWITDIYGFLIAGALITMGTLGDRIGRRKVLLFGAGAFGAASVLAALSTSAEMLIAARAIQGLAGATLAPSAMALVSVLFADEKQRTAALGIMMASFAGGAGLGPIIGGTLLEFLPWGSVFIANVPVMAALLVLGPRLIPEYRAPSAHRLDLLSAALSVVAILAVIYGVKDIATEGLATSSLLAIAGGLVVGIAFVARQVRLDDPLIDVSLFRNREFTAALAANVTGAMVMYGIFLFISQFMQLGLGLSPLEAGLLGLPGIAAMMVVSTMTPKIVAVMRPAYAIATGMGVSALGMIMLTQVGAESGTGLLVVANIVMSVGIAPAATLGMGLILGAAPPERTGSASGVSETGNELGGALGIALLGSLGTAIYRGDMESAVPSDVAPAVADAARDTLGGATTVAAQLPDGVINTAHAAFASGMHVVAGVAAALMVGMAIVTAITLRRVGADDQAASHEAPSLTPALAAEAA